MQQVTSHVCSVFFFTAALTLQSSCGSARETYLTLLDQPLPQVQSDAVTRARLIENLEQSKFVYDQSPEDEDAIIWYGRRLAYLSRYRESIEVYSRGLVHKPDSYRILRHRGHRYISVRELDRAIEDLEHAANLSENTQPRIEQDGIPNSRNMPISTTQGNIWYHLGLGRYLKGDYEGALHAYNQRLARTDRNDDNNCSTAYWRYLILRRLGRYAEAREAIEHINESMGVIENFGYRDLCLLFKGEKTIGEVLNSDNDSALAFDVENATLAYGISMYHMFNGDPSTARTMWKAIVSNTNAAYAFGFIAAEAELSGIPGDGSFRAEHGTE